MQISIAKQFTDAPGGRYIADGPYSGQLFRQQFLEPTFFKGEEEIVVDLDGTFGYATSFLEEAFGGLARLLNSSPEKVLKRVKFISNEDPALPERIQTYIRQEK